MPVAQQTSLTMLLTLIIESWIRDYPWGGASDWIPDEHSIFPMAPCPTTDPDGFYKVPQFSSPPLANGKMNKYNF